MAGRFRGTWEGGGREGIPGKGDRLSKGWEQPLGWAWGSLARGVGAWSLCRESLEGRLEVAEDSLSTVCSSFWGGCGEQLSF